MNNQDRIKIKIDKQIARWELYAKVAPICFILIFIFLLWTDFVELTVLYYVSLVLIAVTSTVWWFWSIYTVRYVISKMSNASHSLDELKAEIEEIKKNMIKPPNLD